MQIDREVMGQFLCQSSIFFLIYTRNKLWLSDFCLRKLHEPCHVLLLGTLSNLGTSSGAKLDSLSRGTATEYFLLLLLLLMYLDHLLEKAKSAVELFFSDFQRTRD